MEKEEKVQIVRQIAELRTLFSHYTARDDVQRMRDAADTIENLLSRVEALEYSNKALRGRRK